MDEGPRTVDPILLVHGQPSWSYLNHTYRLEQLINILGLANITTFVQDGVVYVVGLHPEWFSRIVVGDGTLPEFGGGGYRLSSGRMVGKLPTMRLFPPGLRWRVLGRFPVWQMN